MRSNDKAQPVRLVANRAHHIRLHLELARRTLFFGIKDAAGNHELDKIDTLQPGSLNLRKRLWNATCRDGNRTGHVTSRHRYAHIGSKNARSLQLSRRGVITHARVEVTQAAYCSYGGDAAVQLHARVFGDKAVGDGSRKTIRHNFPYQRLVITLLLLGFAVACQMHMHVYEARKEIGALEVKGLASRQIGIG